MKHYSIFGILFTILFSASSMELYALQFWAMAVMEEGKVKPAIIEYHSLPETAENEVEYQRIYDDGYLFRYEPYNPIKLPYGYKLADKQILIYDFDNKKETIAFDFNLSVGDHFTTFNGMEWVVEAVKDTMVTFYSPLCGMEKSFLTKRLLNVRTTDGKLTDQWLEDFGSFTNHFMINSLEGLQLSQTLWMEYDFGEYITRDINIDPLYTHDSGWMEDSYAEFEAGEYDEANDHITRCYYEDGNVVFEDSRWIWPHREYTCFYREGDDIFYLYWWELEPLVDGGEEAVRKNVFTFEGLPTPTSGKYTIHYQGEEYYTTTGIRNIVTSSHQPAGSIYDLQGRKLTAPPTKGMYIKDRIKTLAR